MDTISKRVNEWESLISKMGLIYQHRAGADDRR